MKAPFVWFGGKRRVADVVWTALGDVDNYVEPFAGSLAVPGRCVVSEPYCTIVADPPWPSMHQRSTYHRGKPERHYKTMTVADIAALEISDLAASSAHLWIWGVNRTLGAAYEVAEAWGFTPMSLLTWCKPGPGMGYYLRNNTEHAVFATRGKPMVPEKALISSWYQWPRRRHSEKPDEFFGLVEQISPGPYLELFARRRRPGWDAWGNEIDSDLVIEGAIP